MSWWLIINCGILESRLEIYIHKALEKEWKLCLLVFGLYE